MRTVTPQDVEFWTTDKTEKEEKMTKCDEEAVKHTYKALEIVADSFEDVFISAAPITRHFCTLYKECLYIRSFVGWEQFKPVSEEEKDDMAAEMVMDAEEFPESMCFDVMSEDPDPEVLEFVTIMESMPEKITENMKIRAFELFPKVVMTVGRLS